MEKQLEEIEEMTSYGIHVRQLVVRPPIDAAYVLDKLCRKNSDPSKRRSPLQPLCTLGMKVFRSPLQPLCTLGWKVSKVLLLFIKLLLL